MYNGPIVDAHHHIWRLDDLPWLAGPMLPRIFGEYAAIKRDYLIDEYRHEAEAAGVEQSIYVQANWPNARAVDEVRWVQSVADASGFPQGIVGYADLAAPDIAAVLDAECGARNLRGVRQQLHWHERALYRFASRPDWTDDPVWREGLREVERRGLIFELQLFAPRMAAAAELVCHFPKVQFVLLHAGMLEDRSDSGLAQWRHGMRSLAQYSNVATKLSGLGTFLRRCDPAMWGPVVQETIEMFGPARCLFGSNFPIEKLWTTYADLVNTMRTLLATYSADEQRAIFYDNARRVYGLDEDVRRS